MPDDTPSGDTPSRDTLGIEIDGRACRARKGQMVIEVADANAIPIPRFCYHHKLTVAANCRMCLVEVERAPKPLPACATPVMEGMKVFTRSKTARAAQKSVMEFLLINHPLDCPICDQGGECELQDVAMGYGRDVSRFNERKRAVEDKDLGPLIATDMTRCIHCTRCVRFGEEVAGMPELGATGRGEDLEIGTFIAGSVDSELSGNVIDLCPVGALTSKPFRFRARAWEMEQRDGVAPHDAVGSNIHLHVRRGRVMRVVPRANEAINEVWLSDRDRFGYEGLYSEDRARAPMVRRGGTWREVSWEEALEATAAGLREVVASSGGAALGALASASCTTEELFLFQRLVRGLGSANVDHRVRQRDFSDQDAAPDHPSIGMGLEDLERVDAALLIGSCARKEHPIVNHRLRKASLAGAAVTYLDVMAHDLNLAPAARMVVPPPELVGALAAVTVAAARIAGREPEGLGALAGGIGDGFGGIGSVGSMGIDPRRWRRADAGGIEGASIEQAGSASSVPGDVEGGSGGVGNVLDDGSVPDRIGTGPDEIASGGIENVPGDTEGVTGGMEVGLGGIDARRLWRADAERIARILADAGRSVILLGPQAIDHRDAAALRGLAACLADLTGATLGTLDEGANPAGAWIAGALPHRGSCGAASEPRGLDARAMIEAGLDAWFLMGLEPELDCADGARALKALNRARFVVSLGAFRSEAMSEYAHVILPAAAFAETEGTFVNLSGIWQSFGAAVPPYADARPAWRVLRVLGNLLDLPGFEQETIEDVRASLGGPVVEGSATAGESLAAGGPVAAGHPGWTLPRSLPKPAEEANGLTRIAPVPMHAVDALVRRSKPLQTTKDAEFAGVGLNPATIERLGLADGKPAVVRQNGGSVTLRLVADWRVPEGCAYLPAGVPATAALDVGDGAVAINRSTAGG